MTIAMAVLFAFAAFPGQLGEHRVAEGAESYRPMQIEDFRLLAPPGNPSAIGQPADPDKSAYFTAKWVYDEKRMVARVRIDREWWYICGPLPGKSVNVPCIRYRIEENRKQPEWRLFLVESAARIGEILEQGQRDAEKPAFKGNHLLYEENPQFLRIGRVEHIKDGKWRFSNGAEQLIRPLTKDSKQSAVRIEYKRSDDKTYMLKITPERGNSLEITATLDRTTVSENP